MDPRVEREVKQATQTVKAMVKSQLYLEMFQRGYHRMRAARRYVELFNRKRKNEIVQMLSKCAEIRAKKQKASAKRYTVQQSDTLMSMINDRKAREARNATDTKDLGNVILQADEFEANKGPIVLDTTLEEMKQIEYVNSLSRRKKMLSMLSSD